MTSQVRNSQSKSGYSVTILCGERIMLVNECARPQHELLSNVQTTKPTTFLWKLRNQATLIAGAGNISIFLHKNVEGKAWSTCSCTSQLARNQSTSLMQNEFKNKINKKRQFSFIFQLYLLMCCECEAIKKLVPCSSSSLCFHPTCNIDAFHVCGCRTL